MTTNNQSMEDIARSRFVACLLAGAVGDAIGAPVEFLSKERILERFGPLGITGLVPTFSGIGGVTDDTQMTMFTAEGLLHATLLEKEPITAVYRSSLARAYLRWLHTQGQANQFEQNWGIKDDGWLMGFPELHQRRAPGHTCLYALTSMPSLGELADNDSKGCGGVMRVAPVGLFAWRKFGEAGVKFAFDLACDAAALTHGHPSGIYPSGVFAALIVSLLSGKTLLVALDTVIPLLRTYEGHEETLQQLQLAMHFAAQKTSADEAIPSLGEGWVAEEALAISVYCALVAPTLRDGIILAVNHDGDSDSTGEIAGNLLGVMHGLDAIPETWQTGVELALPITTLAMDLYNGICPAEDELTPEVLSELKSRYLPI